jgi:hypothetical protein
VSARPGRWLLAAALLAAGAARAQTVPVPGDTFDPGNTFDPPALDPFQQTDPRGMTSWIEARRRTPTGFLYPYPPDPQRMVPLTAGWQGTGAVEAGALLSSGDTSETRFGRYADRDSGGIVNWLDLALLHPESDLYFEFAGGSIGRDDAFYRGEIGEAGLWRLRGTWSGIPLPYATDARVLWEGVGTDHLRLPAGLVPGAVTAAQRDAAVAGLDDQTLRVQRDETNVSFELRPDERFQILAHLGYTKREGEKPFGGSLGYPGDLSEFSETVEPIDDRTYEASAALRYADPLWQGNLSYTASMYHDEVQSLTFDMPFTMGSPAIQQGRFALPPDNFWQNVRGEVSRSLPWHGRITTTLSWSRASQDDRLIPPTVNSGTVGDPFYGTVDLDQWNQRASLPRSRSEAAIDNWLVDSSLKLAPWKPLRLGAHFRFFDNDDQTRYTAVNPIAGPNGTGEIGYIAEDGALESAGPERRIFVPGQPLYEDFRYRSLPTSYRTSLGQLTADWSVRGKTVLGAVVEREETDRDYRERRQTRDVRARVSLTSRDLAWMTARLSFQHSWRSGDDYDTNFLAPYFVSSLPGYVPDLGVTLPYQLANQRMFDVARLQENKADLRLNFLLGEDMDLSLVGSYRGDDYGVDYGLRDATAWNANVEWSWQPSPRTSAYVWYGFEARSHHQATINDSAALSNDPQAGGPVFPFSLAWQLGSDERVHSAGAGVRWKATSRITFQSDYAFLSSREEIDYEFASPDALGTGVPPAAAGSHFAPQRYTDHVLTTSVIVTLTEHLSLRVFHRYENSSVQDFAQRHLEPLSDPSALFLGHVDRDFAASLYGISLRLSF